MYRFCAMRIYTLSLRHTARVFSSALNRSVIHGTPTDDGSSSQRRAPRARCLLRSSGIIYISHSRADGVAWTSDVCDKLHVGGCQKCGDTCCRLLLFCGVAVCWNTAWHSLVIVVYHWVAFTFPGVRLTESATTCAAGPGGERYRDEIPQCWSGALI